MSVIRDYNEESKDNAERRYTYDFDHSVMHPFMLRSFEPFFVDGRALELGSFEGRFTERLLAHFTDLTCVEASSEAAAKARKVIGAGAEIIAKHVRDGRPSDDLRQHHPHARARTLDRSRRRTRADQQRVALRPGTVLPRRARTRTRRRARSR